MRVIKTVSEMRAFSEAARLNGRKIAFVPTMGFLHDGHKKLLEEGRRMGDELVLSIFVNPTQFGPKEDFSAYPRDFEKDSLVAKEAGADVIFYPSSEEIYRPGWRTIVEVEGLSDKLCGQARPGHFRGVATVVTKLFNIVRPHIAIFGKKDFQQFVIIKRLVKDLDLDIEIIGIETVREPDGLAMSSRNAYLAKDERLAATAIPKALAAAKELFRSGQRNGRAIEAKVREIIGKEPLLVIEYAIVADPETFEILEEIKDKALLALAVRAGRARLIDNTLLG